MAPPMPHLPPRPVTKADAADALDRTDHLLDRLDDAMRRTLARFTSKESPPDDD